MMAMERRCMRPTTLALASALKSSGVLPVIGTAHAMAEGTSGVGSAGGADKATVAAPKALGPGAYGGAGGVRNATACRGLA